MATPFRTQSLFVAAVHAAALVTFAQAQCDQGWLGGFHLPGVDGTVEAMAVYDDGTGPALFVGGEIDAFGGIATRGIGKWDGERWWDVGGGVSGPGTSSSTSVAALAVYDDGGGPELFVGGYFTSAGGEFASRIAKWNGREWSSVGLGLSQPNDATVTSMKVYDDGLGGGLFVGGRFVKAGTLTVNSIAKWNGSWSALAGGLTGLEQPNYELVAALEVFNDGSGEELYVGGLFPFAGGIAVNHVARWNGTNWASLGDGIGDPRTAPLVLGMATYDARDGYGPGLYVGGQFETAGGAAAADLALWRGGRWSPVATLVAGFRRQPYVSANVRDLTTFDAGDGTALYMCGDFESVNGVASQGLARFNGRTWQGLGGDVQGSVTTDYVALLRSLIGATVAGQSRLYVGGYFAIAAGQGAANIAGWDGNEWSPLGSGHGVDFEARVLTSIENEDSSRVYAGGRFAVAGATPAANIAEFDGHGWTSIGDGFRSRLAEPNDSPWIEELAGFHDEDGVKLFAGGFFDQAGSTTANNVALWDGSQWDSLGSGVEMCAGDECIAEVNALALHDSPAGYELYVGGRFTHAGGVETSNIARWDGSRWHSLESGVNDTVLALAVFDNAQGGSPTVYAGGDFSVAGGVNAARIARWDGEQWHALGSGASGSVRALAVGQVGSSEAGVLYAGGKFMGAGGQQARRVARWDGSNWSPLGPGLGGTTPVHSVDALALVDNGCGSRLIASGRFPNAGDLVVKNIAAWDGRAWHAVDGGITDDGDSNHNHVTALNVVKTGPLAGVYAGGEFDIAGGVPSHAIARLELPPLKPCQSDLDSDGMINGFDLAMLLGDWGVCAPTRPCRGDLDGDGIVGSLDLALLLAAWGPC